MNSLKKFACWEITHCDDTVFCPIRENGTACWEWMAQNNGFQCQYGLCQDCIVYLYYNDNKILSSEEMAEVIRRRMVFHPEM